MRYDEYEKMCREAWREIFNYFCIELTKNRNERKYRICSENKNTDIEFICESEAFGLT